MTIYDMAMCDMAICELPICDKRKDFNYEKIF